MAPDFDTRNSCERRYEAAAGVQPRRLLRPLVALSLEHTGDHETFNTCSSRFLGNPRGARRYVSIILLFLFFSTSFDPPNKNFYSKTRNFKYVMHVLHKPP